MLSKLDFSHAVIRYDEKIDRGGKHLDALNESAKGFVEEHGDPGILCVAEPNSQGTKYLLRVQRVPKFPEVPWGVIVGDAVHCWRSALDQLVAALWTERPVPRSAGFPICLAEKDWIVEAPRMIWSIPEAYVTVLFRAQPYHRGGKQEAQRHPLAVLHALWNLDKHRAIPTTGLVARGLEIREIEEHGMTIGDFKPKLGVTVKPNAVIAEAKIKAIHGTPQAHVKVKAHLSLAVGFGDGGEVPEAVRSKPVVQTFHNVIAPAIASVLRDLHDIQHGKPLAEPWLAPKPSEVK